MQQASIWAVNSAVAYRDFVVHPLDSITVQHFFFAFLLRNRLYLHIKFYTTAAQHLISASTAESNSVIGNLSSCVFRFIRE